MGKRGRIGEGLRARATALFHPDCNGKRRSRLPEGMTERRARATRVLSCGKLRIKMTAKSGDDNDFDAEVAMFRERQEC
jgi:hypothetical protein